MLGTLFDGTTWVLQGILNVVWHLHLDMVS